jgi:hypothetical protein
MKESPALTGGAFLRKVKVKGRVFLRLAVYYLQNHFFDTVKKKKYVD